MSGDICDQTDERMERELELLINAARRPALLESDAPTGECFNGCGEAPLSGGHYCSPECACDHHARKQLLRQKGAR